MPPSACETVFRLSELRQKILRELEPIDMATCMLLEKGSMWDVARELYHTVSFEFSREEMKTTSVSDRDSNEIRH